MYRLLLNHADTIGAVRGIPINIIMKQGYKVKPFL